MNKNAIFVAATGQNVGKTTLCLGLLAGLRKRFGSVGFIKPVGQQHVKVENEIKVDKDVVLFKKHFDLSDSWSDMSPVIIPGGFTKEYLDGKVSDDTMLERISHSFQSVSSQNAFTVVEGTGHVAVGSILNINNAVVAKLLGLDMVIIASGGLGSSFDELALNIAMCEKHGVRVRGVILNRVLEDKREMILDYFPKSLKFWNLPLIGAVPYNDLLMMPTIEDFANLFATKLLTGEKHRFRHFQHSRLVADSAEAYTSEVHYNELIITPASREDIIDANIARHRSSLEKENKDFAGGMIWTGMRPPNPLLIEKAKALDIPTLYVPLCSFDAMKSIASFTSKIRQGDKLKVEKAINLVEGNIDFDLLTSKNTKKS